LLVFYDLPVRYLVLYGNAMSDTAYGALFGVVGGMMVYISLKELLPTVGPSQILPATSSSTFHRHYE
jgi:zinc transporter ZupT